MTATTSPHDPDHPTPDRAEQALLLRIQSGDRAAFREVVERYERYLLTIAFRMVGSQEDARDLTQDAFLKAFRSLDRFRGECSLLTWLRKIVVNLCLNHRASSHQRMVHLRAEARDEESPEPLDLLASDLPTPEERAARREELRLVERALGMLSPEFRAVLVLREVQGLAYDEIAGILDIQEGTVKSRLSRARQEMRSTLRQWGIGR